MVFSSIVFIFYFLPVFLILYYLTGSKNIVLLAGSILFYVWGEGSYVFLLAGLVLINYAAGLILKKSAGVQRRVILSAAIVVDLATLGVFKYTRLVGDTVTHLRLLASLPPLRAPEMHLPLGISFFTFQMISYLVDIYRQKTPAETSLTRLASYVMMFPHLIAGPIVRYGDIAEELRKRRVTLERIGLGTQYFVVGLCQKVILANTVARAADAVFSLPPEQLRQLSAWLGTLAYTLQIYFDFCGYSNMAIGLAFFLGFRFPKNFDYPYAAKSITEFWRRWHITLSSWFRDYVYIPLGGNRKGDGRTLFNLVAVFFLTGLWHGASWTFVIWGLYHGCFLLLERVGLRKLLARSPRVLQSAYTLLVVMIGWVLFRANTFAQARLFIHAMFSRPTTVPWTPPTFLWLTPEVLIALVVGTVVAFPTVPRLLELVGQTRIDGATELAHEARYPASVHAVPIAVLIVGFALSLVLLVTGTLNPFLYFRF